LNIITTKEQLDEMVAYYLKQDAFAFDVETVGQHRGVPAVNEVLWISFATRGRGDVIPMGHPNGEFLEEIKPLTGQGQKRVDAGLKARYYDYSRNKKKYVIKFDKPPKQLFPAEVFKTIKPLMFNENILTIGHNLIFDLCSVAKHYDGVIPSGPYFDTLIGSFLYDSRNTGRLGLDDCLQRDLGFNMEKGIGHRVEEYSFDDVAKYSYLDSKYTFLLWQVVAPKIVESDVEKVMDLEMNLLKVLCQMKLTGAAIDTKHLKELHVKLEGEIEVVKSKIYSIAGKVFNLNSNAEKQQLLYGPVSEGNRGLKPTILTGKGKKTASDKRTYSDYSVSAEALEEHPDDELVVALLEYAELNKLLSTYIIPYVGGEVVKSVNGKEKIEERESLLINGKIYGDFKPWGAETGRFSSANPNLQNIPAPNDKVPDNKNYGKMIRDLFYAPEGYKLVVADYSQIEPRIIASMSGDPIMIENYKTGGDIYTTVGNTMGVDRKAGKVLVLAIAYGVGPDKISRQIGCTIQEAKTLLTDFSAKFPSVDLYRAKVIGVARNTGYVSTILKRRRYLPDIKSKVPTFKASAERQAFNTRIQGSAADIIKLAMIRAYERVPAEAKIILTVHDEIVTLTPDHLVDQTYAAIKEAMEEINFLDVPLIADIKVVQRWGEAKS
jgi:DNA polymerase I-like protein with 3'-5' exonuclease and polymerase domains